MLRIFTILRYKMIWLAMQLIINVVGVELKRNYKQRHFMFNEQQHRHYNCFISQLGTSCVFDSPGLARNEPTPGEHPQGDSTP